MNPRLIVLTILAVVAMVCFTIITCVHMVVNSNEKEREHFLVNVPNKVSGP